MKEYTDEELREWDTWKQGLPEGYVECPHCLHGWRRDVEPEGYDEECVTCNYTGFLKSNHPLIIQRNKWRIERENA